MLDTMLDTIEAARVKAQSQAATWGIHEIVRNIAEVTGEAEWEGCTLRYESEHINDDGSGVNATSIVMNDGTGRVLYRAFQSGGYVTDFRFGSWVERIVAYSEAKTQRELEEKLTPFSEIDF